MQATIIMTCFLLILSQAVISAPVANYEEQMKQAQAYRLENELAAAETIYTEILKANPGDVDARVGRGFCYLRSDDLYPKAEEDFSQVIEASPAYIDAYYGLALVYKRTGRWDEAKMVLQQAAEQANDEQATDYLAEICWRVGHVSLARILDTQDSAERTRQIKGFRDEVFLNYTYDFVKDRSDWQQAGLTYIHHFRPDFNAGISFTKYRRNDMDDHQIGLHLGYQHDMDLSVEYNGYYATDQNFLAKQKHQPTLYYNLFADTVVGLGGRFDQYDDGWGEVGRFNVKRYLGACFGEYDLLAGCDNFDRSVTTHIVKLGYEHDKLLGHLGYSYGDETIDSFGGSSFSNQLVESVFVNVKYFIDDQWGIIVAGGPEFRDHDLYRTTCGASVFVRF
jgi:YaiO family outer membrane protein